MTRMPFRHLGYLEPERGRDQNMLRYAFSRETGKIDLLLEEH